MYSITETTSGTYWCELQYQDGTERWEEPTKDAAIKAMIGGAYAWNHVDITIDKIEFYKEQWKGAKVAKKSKVPDPTTPKLDVGSKLAELERRLAYLESKFKD